MRSNYLMFFIFDCPDDSRKWMVQLRPTFDASKQNNHYELSILEIKDEGRLPAGST